MTAGGRVRDEIRKKRMGHGVEDPIPDSFFWYQPA